ncbi:MAG: ribosomal protein S18-alanine N-acetyltransferase [Pseudomonadota bacterium]
MIQSFWGVFTNKQKSVVQPADHDDLSAISEIHRASFDRGWSDGEFAALLAQDNYFCLVARKSGTNEKLPYGFVLIKRVLDEAEVISIATVPKARRRGLARQLMDAAIRQLNADRVKLLFLEVDNQNQAAVHLYKRLGFKEIGSRQGYYENKTAGRNKRSSALVMQLELG